jgi:ribonuclease HI
MSILAILYLSLGCFAEGLNNGNSLFAELIGAMRSIELASSKNWRNFWLETDSMLVVQAFKSQDIVPWQLRNGVIVLVSLQA